MPAIEILGLEKTYSVGFWRKKPKQALRPLHLTVEEGEIFGYLGPNGAGKTTTLKLLMGLMYPTSGSARITGSRNQRSRDESANRLSSRTAIFLRLSYRRRIAALLRTTLGRGRKGTQPQSGPSAYSEWDCPMPAGFSCASFPRECCSELELPKRFFTIRRWFFSTSRCPAWIPWDGAKFANLMEELKHEGKTVFFSTHILSDAEALCDRVAIINKGELQGVGAVADLTSSVNSDVELVWQGPSHPTCPYERLGAECHVTGETVRAIVSETNQDAAIEALRRERLRLISVTPVRTSLEDYFMQQVAAD